MPILYLLQVRVQPSKVKEVWLLFRFLLWAGLFGLMLYYIAVVFVPFYSDDIYRLSDAEIWSSTKVIFSEVEIHAFTLWICFGFPLFVLLGAELVRSWHSASRLARTLRLTVFVPAL